MECANTEMPEWWHHHTWGSLWETALCSHDSECAQGKERPIGVLQWPHGLLKVSWGAPGSLEHPLRTAAVGKWSQMPQKEKDARAFLWSPWFKSPLCRPLSLPWTLFSLSDPSPVPTHSPGHSCLYPTVQLSSDWVLCPAWPRLPACADLEECWSELAHDRQYFLRSPTSEWHNWGEDVCQA